MAPLRIDVFSIFPEMVDHIADQSVIGRGRRDGHLDIRVHDLRQTTTDVHQTVDDAPFGGGAGMVMKPEPLFGAVEAVEPPRPLFYLSPAGRRFDQTMAHELAELDGFSLLCGRYEGIDERVREHLCDGEISVGDVVLAGGEVAAALIIEAVGRLVPGVLGNATSTDDESFRRWSARVPALHPAGRFPGLADPRGPPVRRPRQGRPLATGEGDRAHGAGATGPARGARWPQRGRAAGTRRVRHRTRRRVAAPGGRGLPRPGWPAIPSVWTISVPSATGAGRRTSATTSPVRGSISTMASRPGEASQTRPSTPAATALSSGQTHSSVPSGRNARTARRCSVTSGATRTDRPRCRTADCGRRRRRSRAVHP